MIRLTIDPISVKAYFSFRNRYMKLAQTLIRPDSEYATIGQKIIEEVREVRSSRK